MIHSVQNFSEDNNLITVHNFILVDIKRTHLTCTQEMRTEDSHLICKRENSSCVHGLHTVLCVKTHPIRSSIFMTE